MNPTLSVILFVIGLALPAIVPTNANTLYEHRKMNNTVTDRFSNSLVAVTLVSMLISFALIFIGYTQFAKAVYPINEISDLIYYCAIMIVVLVIMFAPTGYFLNKVNKRKKAHQHNL